MLHLENKLKEYVSAFSSEDEEIYRQKIPNEKALQWMNDNIPLLDCPDPDIERTYYFRYWTFRKHLRDTPDGVVITEFLPDVGWSGIYNTICCANGFHIREGRWLRRERSTIENYIRFWLTKGNARDYSSWLAWAVKEFCDISGDESLGTELLPALIREYQYWDKEHLVSGEGLYWSVDDSDGMECSISGSGMRPTINSYMYGNAIAIAEFADKSGDESHAWEYREKADLLKDRIQKRLYRDGFFKTTVCNDERLAQKLSRGFNAECAKAARDTDARELIGFVPWYFSLPDSGYESGFADLTDPAVFFGKKGLRTGSAESPRYRFSYPHECLWNGPTWPFATGQTLAACANLLDNYQQSVFTKENYMTLLHQYAASQILKREDGSVVPWIDENMDPETGEWIARSILLKRGGGCRERGKDYNHSLFCDLVISGMFGVRPNGKDDITVSPKFPASWDYCAIDCLPVCGHTYTVQYDRTGQKYHNGAGLLVYRDGTLIRRTENC